jgi:hypothetical protein
MSWLAIVCLLAAWVHVWIHHSSQDVAGHFGPEAGHLCQLADIPPTVLPDAPACAERAGWHLHPVAVHAAARGDRPHAAHRIRAPPLA